MLGLRQSFSRESSRMARMMPSSVFSAALPPTTLRATGSTPDRKALYTCTPWTVSEFEDLGYQIHLFFFISAPHNLSGPPAPLPTERLCTPARQDACCCRHTMHDKQAADRASECVRSRLKWQCLAHKVWSSGVADTPGPSHGLLLPVSAEPELLEVAFTTSKQASCRCDGSKDLEMHGDSMHPQCVTHHTMLPTDHADH